MEFSPDKNIIYPLRLKDEFANELNRHLLLCYTGKYHNSGEVHKIQEESLNESNSNLMNLYDLKHKAIEIRDCLVNGELDSIGKLLHECWENKKRSNNKISNTNIDRLYNIGIRNGALGGKLLGAGGGGYILFFCSPLPLPPKSGKISRPWL